MEDSDLNWVNSCEPLKVLEQEGSRDQSARGGRWVREQGVGNRWCGGEIL